LDAATKLVNSTISENSEGVERFLRGSGPIAVIEKRFEAPTGYEAYLERRNSQPYMRDTYGVRAIILRDPGSSRGYNVRSAFPIR